MTIAVCIDPGTTTGVAVMDETGTVHWSGQFDVKETLDYLYMLTQDEEALYSFDVELPDIMICEDYRQGPLSAVAKARMPLEILGATKFTSHSLGVPIIIQPAADMKFWNAHHPLPSGIATGLPHAKDAIRHGRYYFQLK